jgi:DNA-binding response OmpR family regulator
LAASSLSTDPDPLHLSVLLTAVDRLKGYQGGAVDYISVPIVPELLRAKVSVFAELHRRAQQLEALNVELRFHRSTSNITISLMDSCSAMTTVPWRLVYAAGG